MLAEPGSWRTGGCAGCCGGRFTVCSAHPPPRPGRPPPASPRSLVREARSPHPLHVLSRSSTTRPPALPCAWSPITPPLRVAPVGIACTCVGSTGGVRTSAGGVCTCAVARVVSAAGGPPAVLGSPSPPSALSWGPPPSSTILSTCGPQGAASPARTIAITRVLPPPPSPPPALDPPVGALCSRGPPRPRGALARSATGPRALRGRRWVNCRRRHPQRRPSEPPPSVCRTRDMPPTQGGAAIGQGWTRRCRSSRACPTAFIANSVPFRVHVFDTSPHCAALTSVTRAGVGWGGGGWECAECGWATCGAEKIRHHFTAAQCGTVPGGVGGSKVRCGPAAVAPATPAPRPSLLSQFIACSVGQWPCSCSVQVPNPTSVTPPPTPYPRACDEMNQQHPPPSQLRHPSMFQKYRKDYNDLC